MSSVSRSADISFRLIALQKGLLTKERLDEAQAEARRRRVPLEQVLAEAGDLDSAALDRVRETRARHARRCSACGERTYLLPRQTVANTPCERCGGALEEAAGTGAAGAAPRPPAGPRAPSREGGPRPGGSAPRRPAGGPAAAGAAAGARPGPRPTSERQSRQDSERVGPPERPTARPSERRPAAPPPEAAAAEPPREGAAAAPAPPVLAESPDEAAAREERARRMRREGGGLGYEPPEEPIERPRRRIGLPSEPPPSAVEAEPAPGEATSDEDDARFAPPAEHLARFGRGAAAPGAPVKPIREDLLNLLRFPVQSKETVALVTLGALFLMLGGISGGGGLALFKKTMLLGVLFVAYPALYQARITRTSLQGSQELPDWPDFHFGDIGAFVVRMFTTMVACFAPAALILCLAPLVGGGGDGSEHAGPRLTIGDDAYLSAPSEPYIPKGTPMSVEEPFLDLDENPLPIGRGRWTIVGLLGRDLADDTGMTQMMVDMPRGGFGIAINPAWQVYDLDRVAMSLPEVEVYAAYADPREVLIGARYPWTQDAPAFEETFVEEEEDVGEREFGEAERDALRESLAEAQGMAELGGRVAGDGRDWTTGGAAPRLEAAQLVKTDTIDWPAPLDQLETYPAVVVIDPQGRVVREYSSGVHDEKLYSDVKDLMAGGEGNVWSTEELPIYGGGGGGAGGVVGMLLFLLLVAAGYLYMPMAWLLMVAFDSPSTPFMYGAGIRAIAIAWRDYLALALVLLGLQVAGWVVLEGVGGVLEAVLPWYVGYPLVGLTGHWIQFYGMLVTAYGVGRYYYANRRAINWFDEALKER